MLHIRAKMKVSSTYTRQVSFYCRCLRVGESPCIPAAQPAQFPWCIVPRKKVEKSHSEKIMYDIVVCPECQRRLQLPAEYVGNQVTCPQCSTTFTASAGNATTQASEEVNAAAMTVAPVPTGPETPDQGDEPVARKRRKARLTSEPKPAARAKRTIMIVFGLVGILVACAFCGLANLPRHEVPNFAFRPQGNAVDDDLPLGPLPAMNPEQNLRDMKEFFQNFSRAIRARDEAAVAICFDTKRSVDELAKQNNFPAQLRRDNRFETQLNQGFARAVLLQEGHWANHEIRNIRAAGKQELVVITRHRNKVLGGTVRFRWWLTSRRGTWRIYDLEDLDLGMRVSFLMGTIIERGVNQGDLQLLQDVNAVKDATHALVLRQDVGEAERHLNKSNVANLPKALAGAHHMMRGIVRIRQQRFQEGLASCDEAARCYPDMPGLDYLKAVACNSLKRYDQALEHARKYHDLVGDDPETCFELGLALQQLFRFKEAATYYRRALDEEPNHLDSFFNLLRCTGGPEGTHNLDIAERFLKQERPQDQFEQCAQECLAHRDSSTLEKLALAMRKADAGHADAAYYLGLARVDLRKVDDAMDAFRTALKLQTLAGRREFYYAEFAKVLVLQDNVVQVYPKLPEPALAFRSLALALKNPYRLDELQELIDLRVKEQADDTYVPLYQAELYVREEQFALAEKIYAAALPKIKDAQLLETLRPNRVLVRYQTGNVLGAYREIGPRGATFQQLADLCWRDKKTDDLIALVEAHAKNDAQDPKLFKYRWRAKVRQGKFDEVGAIFKAALEAKQGEQERKQLSDDFFFDMIDANQAVVAYRYAINPTEAFGLMFTDLLELNKLAELQAVSDAHRKQFPKDPFLSICAGEIALAEKNWAKAAQAYTEAWKTMPEPQRLRWQHSYSFARYKAGQAIQAYHDAGRRSEIFRILARQILADKQADLFEQLLEAHRPQRKDDPQFDAFEARLKVVRGKPDEAAELFARCWKNLPEPERQGLHADFVVTLAEWNLQGLAAYTYSPDKRAAFQQLAWRYRNPKQVKEFERLIQEHAKNDPNDPKLPLEQAELHLLRGEAVLAEKQFALAKEKGNANDKYAVRTGLIRARIRLGKIVQTYEEFGAGNQTFLDLASQCISEKNPDQLQGLLAAHRLAIPTFKNVALWELEICWLKKDYEGALNRITPDRARLLGNPTTRWKAESYLVRSLVRLQKSKAALHEAEALNRRNHGPYLLVALALAASGDVPGMVAFAKDRPEQRFFLEDAYRDEDLGPILRSDAFRMFREQFPEPAPANP
jgi:hypothetical protein